MDTTKTAEALAKAIGYTENGGKPNLKKPSKGKTGEMASIYQFTPDTWKNYSTQIFGKVVPMNADSETQVVLNKVNKWLETGYKPEQILSMWNAGTGEPDAYGGKFSNGQPSIGVNAKYGVKFDVPTYVKKGMKYFGEFSGGQNTQPQSNEVAQTSEPNQPEQTPSSNKNNNGQSVQKLLAIMNEAKQNATKSQTPQVAQNTGLINQTT